MNNDFGVLPLQLVDEVGNPLPPGILVTVSADGQVVGSDYTQVDANQDMFGVTAIMLSPATIYSCTLLGSLAMASGAPLPPFAFATPSLQLLIELGDQPTQSVVGDPLVPIVLGSIITAAEDQFFQVRVPGYRSPFASQSGYADLQAFLWPLDRFSDAARSPGGVAYSVAYGISGILYALDTQIQVAITAQRLLTASGSMVDSWVDDVLGAGTLSRQDSEVGDDHAYIARVQQWLTAAKTTCYGIQIILQSFLVAILATPLPQVIVFDWQSNPELARLVGLQRGVGQFCILLVYDSAPIGNWFLGDATKSFLGVNTFLATAAYTQVTQYSADLSRIVNLLKEPGSWPVYYTNSPSSIP